MQTATASLYADLPERSLVASPASERVTMLAQQSLLESAYYVLRQVRCEFHEGRLTLHGSVPSWHMKQMAQTLVSNVESVDRIDNRLEVAPRRQVFPAC